MRGLLAILALMVLLCNPTEAGAQGAKPGGGQQSQAQQGLCNEKCVTTLDDEGLPHGTGCVIIHNPADPQRGEDCLAGSHLPPGSCEIDQSCQGAGFAWIAESGEVLSAGEGCLRVAALRLASLQRFAQFPASVEWRGLGGMSST